MKGALERPYGGSTGTSQLEDSEAAVRMGQRVAHAKFGEGVVVQSEGSGDRARIQVNFAQAGAKWLMMGYANLEILD